MKHSIINDNFQVTIQQKGAELCSIKSLKTDKEYMWNANPEIWGSHAPVLFPAIGSFKNGECSIDGKTYKIPKHGFIRHNEHLVVESRTETKINFQLDYSDVTLAMYPYEFQFHIIFEVIDNQIIISHKVVNLDNQPIYFHLGGHPAFKCPVNDNEVYSDYYLEFEKTETVTTTLLSQNGLISDETRPVLHNSNILPLHKNLFDSDALIFKNLKSRKVSLKSHQSNQVLSVSFPDFPYLGIWAKPNAPFICIEPWIGIADHEDTDGDFLKKDRLIRLPSKELFEAKYTIEITE